MIEPGQWDDPMPTTAPSPTSTTGAGSAGRPRGDRRRRAGHHQDDRAQHGRRGVRRALLLRGLDGGRKRQRAYRFQEDPNGNPLSPNHPWNKETIPRPQATNWKDKYSWSTAPRWDRMAMESGPYSRMWANALAEDYSHLQFIEPTGKSFRFNMPERPSGGRDRVDGPLGELGRVRAQPPAPTRSSTRH